jgi:undecaprenyl pyrophosphate phosphatase UppP
MPLAQLVVHAATAGFTEAAGLSGQAHATVLGLWVASPGPAEIGSAAGLGTGLGAVVATRARLFPALSGAASVLSHPASFLTHPRAREALVFAWIPAVSAVLSLLLRRAGASPPPSPHTLALGLGATGIALLLAVCSATLRGAGKEKGEPPPGLLLATLVGAAHALGVWPGVSRVGLAAATLLAAGARPSRALSFALVATVPFWWADFATGLPDMGALGTGQALLVALVAFLGALVASTMQRMLAQRRIIIVLSLWMIPLACALFAYARVA